MVIGCNGYVVVVICVVMVMCVVMVICVVMFLFVVNTVIFSYGDIGTKFNIDAPLCPTIETIHLAYFIT